MKNILFNHCLICGSLIDNKELICASCKEHLDSERFSSFAERCPVCFYPRLGPEYRCKNCQMENSMPIYSLLDYNAVYGRKMIDRLKFSFDKSFAPLLSVYLNECIEHLDPSGEGVIVPVPCSAASLKKRGWDQMKLICSFIKRRTVYAVVNISESNIQQKTLDKEGREVFAKTKYALNEKLSNKDRSILSTTKVIIVDDIVTTSSTLYAVAKVLRNAGFNNLCAATVLCVL